MFHEFPKENPKETLNEIPGASKSTKISLLCRRTPDAISEGTPREMFEEFSTQIVFKNYWRNL